MGEAGAGYLSSGRYWGEQEYSGIFRNIRDILGNGYRIQGQNYVALLQGLEKIAGFHYRNWILDI